MRCGDNGRISVQPACIIRSEPNESVPTPTLANKRGPQQIRVNTVHPGAVGTATLLNETTFKRLRPDLDSPTAEDAATVLAALNLLPVPWVEPIDVANAVVFLASDAARYITGTQLIVDAGLTQKT